MMGMEKVKGKYNIRSTQLDSDTFSSFKKTLTFLLKLQTVCSLAFTMCLLSVQIYPFR